MAKNMNQLTQTQQTLVNQIIETGKKLGMDDVRIEAAVSIANAESTFTPDAPNKQGTSAYGLFQYNNASWNSAWADFVKANPSNPLATKSASDVRDNPIAQITIMYQDLTKWYTGYEQGILAKNFMPKGNDYNQVIALKNKGIDITTDFVSYAYFRHHTGVDETSKIIIRDIDPNMNIVSAMVDNYKFNGTTSPIKYDSSVQSNLDYDVVSMLQQSIITSAQYNNYTTWSTDQLVHYSDSVNTNLNYNLGSNSDFGVALKPIGAFYDVQNSTVDNTPSIAKETPVFLDLNNKAYTVATLTALDVNKDKQLTGTELSSIRAWVDLNENGIAETGEIQSLSALNIAQVRDQDYTFYTQGNGIMASVEPSQASNYQTIANQTVYKENLGIIELYLTTTGNYVKFVSYGGQNYLVGTNGTESFDKANMIDMLSKTVKGGISNFKSLGSVTNFLAGAGDDAMGGGTGNDKLWGGTGNDTLGGYAGNDIVYGEEGNDLLFGEEGNDKLVGGVGDDSALGGVGLDILWGDAGNDELQGNEGDDYLYGGLDMDKLFGQVGNDVLYGGEGDDILVGFMAANETKKDLSTGETDHNLIYGGGGQDTLIGGLGNDYLDGGAGADKMQGGTGNDVYIVNSVNDSILEKKDAGYDTVISSTNYQLNYGIEELRLIRDLEINATGNALNNRLIGNNKNNIIDGVTGKDTMIGGQGNDTYYIDDIEDKIEEYINEGTDTVQASISYTLGGNLENLVLLDFSKPEEGLVNNKEILVYGYPKRYELDYMQGDADPDYQGTCALTSIANVLVQSGKVVTADFLFS